jgi:hypothetical protein
LPHLKQFLDPVVEDLMSFQTLIELLISTLPYLMNQKNNPKPNLYLNQIFINIQALSF